MLGLDINVMQFEAMLTIINFQCIEFRRISVEATTVVSEKKGTFICELLLERYIYSRDTQKQLKITNYVRNKSFLEVYLVYNGVSLKHLGSIL